MFCGLHPADILCLTFTNAAALEMESRISQILESLYLNKDGFTENYIAERLGISEISSSDIVNAESMFFKFQDNFSNVKILTIHSFCQKFIQQFPLEAGVSPNFKIADEYDSAIILQQAKKNAVERLAMREDLWVALSGSMSTYSFEELIERAYGLAANFNEFFDAYCDLNSYEAALRNMLRPKAPVEFSVEQLKFIEKEGLSLDNLESKFLTASGSIRKRFAFNDKATASSIAEVVFENSQNLKKLIFITKNCKFLEAVKVVLDEYRVLKDSQNVIDFTDVLYKTKRLLTKSRAKEFVLSNICSGIRSIMIDEAQDLSAIQWDLISLWSNDMFHDASNDKSIMVVGDSKQSIYRFQGAYHEMFSDFYERCKASFKALGKPIKTVCLNVNHRAVPEILSKIDQVFEHINENMTSEFTRYRKHIASRPSIGTNTTFEMVDLFNVDDKAKIIADHICNRSKISNDILILMRNRSSLANEVVDELYSRNARVVFSDKVILAERPLIMDLLAMADICVNETNDYSVARVLQSPYFFDIPLTPDDLYPICHGRTSSVLDRLRTLDPDKYAYVMKIVSYCNLEQPLEFFYNLAHRIKRLTTRDSEILSAFIEEILQFTDAVNGTTEEFLSYFCKRNKEIKNVDITRNAVRLSTIHSSKGLEADSVFLLDFDIEAAKSKIKAVFPRKGSGRNICLIRPSQRESFKEIEDIMEHEYAEEKAELMRLLYVAMTRARNYLLIFGEGNGNSAYSLISQAIHP
jgi:ATP-dependent helicase/nuclease subunit A